MLQLGSTSCSAHRIQTSHQLGQSTTATMRHVGASRLATPQLSTRCYQRTSCSADRCLTSGPSAMWTRPMPDRDADFIKPSYIPNPSQAPVFQPRREDGPLYTPVAPEFKPAELPENPKELPQGPAMPARRPDPIPASVPKERPPTEPDRREAPPSRPAESPAPSS